MFVHTSNIEVTGLNTDDKWRINKLEGKNVRAARPETEKKVVAEQEKTTDPNWYKKYLTFICTETGKKLTLYINDYSNL